VALPTTEYTEEDLPTAEGGVTRVTVGGDTRVTVGGETRVTVLGGTIYGDENLPTTSWSDE